MLSHQRFEASAATLPAPRPSPAERNSVQCSGWRDVSERWPVAGRDVEVGGCVVGPGCLWAVLVAFSEYVVADLAVGRPAAGCRPPHSADDLFAPELPEAPPRKDETVYFDGFTVRWP